MADILTSKIQVPSLPNDTLILKDAEARNDLSTALATATGNPLNFSTRSAQKAKETVISLEPIQDLHGYDHPWPAGGGKNKLPLTVNRIKGANNEGTWSGNSYTYNNVVYDILTDDANNIIGIKANGTAQGHSKITISFKGLASGDYYFSGSANGGGKDTNFNLYCYDNNISGRLKKWDGTTSSDSIYNSNTSEEIKVTDSSHSMVLNIRIYSGYNAQNLMFYPMIRLATETDPTFAPYSNYCPIDGRTETSLVGCGKNLVNVDDLDLIQYNAEGSERIGLIFDTPGTYTVSGKRILTGEVYIFAKKVSNGVYENSNYVVSPTHLETFTFSIGNNDKLLIYCSVNSLGNISLARYQFLTDEVQVEFSPSATVYEPFVQSNNLTIQFGEKVYGATVELEKGTVTVDTEIVDMGTLTWNKYSSEPNVFRTSSLSQNKPASNNYVSSHYKTENYSTTTASMADMSVKGYSSDERIFVKDSRYYDLWDSGDMTAFAQAMSGVQLCYPLATPRTIQLTPNEISLLMGVNNISTDGDSISLTYRDGKVATLGDLDELNSTINNALEGKVDEVSGKGLSTNDYTDEEKAKVAEIDAKADDDGSYGDMAVGSLLMSNAVKSTDTTPFLFRPIPHLSTPYIREKLIGASMAWNQIIPKTAATETKQGVTFTNNDDGSWTLTGTPDNNNCVKNLNYETNKWTLLPNHIYYARAMSGNNKIGIALCGNDGYDYGGIKMVLNEEKIIKLSAFLTVPSTWCRLQIANLTDVNIGTVTFSPQVIDLTLAFGTAIANRIYSMEQAQAGSGIAWIKSYGFLTEDYYANDAGSIQSVCTDRKEIVGKNKFNPSTRTKDKAINEQGEIVDSSAGGSYSDLMSVVGGQSYTYSGQSGSWSGDYSNKRIHAYVDGVWMEQITYERVSNNTPFSITFTVPSGANGIRISALYSDTNIQVELGSTATDYEPYHKTTISLGHDELRGVMKLDANNNLVYYGDEKSADGTVTRKFGIVDLGSLSWIKTSSYTHNFFYGYLVVKRGGTCKSDKYLTIDSVTSGTFGESAENLDICLGASSDQVFIRDDAYSDKDSFAAAMSGHYLIYELATPTTEQSTPFTSPQYLFDGGTEEFVDYGVEQETRDVAVPVGHVTEYMESGEDKVFFPTLPSADGEYIPHIKVQGGVITDFWFESVVEDGD